MGNHQAPDGMQGNQIIEETGSPSTKDPRGTQSLKRRKKVPSGIIKSNKNVHGIEKINETL